MGTDLGQPSQATLNRDFILQEKDETDSGYRSGTIPDEKLPRQPSQATLNRDFILQEKDETDSGYRSGTIPDEKLPRQPSQATLNREELKKKLEEYNTLVPGANLQLVSDWDLCGE